MTHLNTETVPAMLGRPVFPLIGKPVVRLHGDPFSLVSGNELIEIRNSHAATNDLANSRDQYIYTFREIWCGRQCLHVETLENLGEVNQHDGSTYLIGHLAFGGFSDVVTDDMSRPILFMDAVLIEVCDGVAIVEAEERTSRCLEVWVEGVDDLGSGRIGKEDIYDSAYLTDELTDNHLGTTHQIFQMIQQVLELYEHQFGF